LTLAAVLALTPIISNVLHDSLVRRERIEQDDRNEQCGDDDAGRSPSTNGASGGCHRSMLREQSLSALMFVAASERFEHGTQRAAVLGLDVAGTAHW
jgi:hypothetical protein